MALTRITSPHFLRMSIMLLLVLNLGAYNLIAQDTDDATDEDAVVTTTEQITYVVQRGDNLFRIAQRFGLTVQQLADANGITNTSLIFVGQRLIIPTDATTPSETTPDDPTPDEPEPLPPLATIDDVAFERGITVFLEGQDIDALVSQVAQMRFVWVRMTANWRTIEPIQGQPDLALLDEAVQKFSNAGIKILLTVTGAPDWARPSATPFVLELQSDYGPPDDTETFALFISQLATRYADDVQAFEIWNEPNLRRTWISPDVTGRLDARMSQLRYIDLLADAYEAIKAVNPDALVITGGLAPTGLNDRINAIDDRVFLAALIEQDVAQVSDGIGVQAAGFANPPDALCCDQPEGVPTHYEDERFYFLETLRTYRQILIDKDAESLDRKSVV